MLKVLAGVRAVSEISEAASAASSLNKRTRQLRAAAEPGETPLAGRLRSRSRSTSVTIATAADVSKAVKVKEALAVAAAAKSTIAKGGKAQAKSNAVASGSGSGSGKATAKAPGEAGGKKVAHFAIDEDDEENGSEDVELLGTITGAPGASPSVPAPRKAKGSNSAIIDLTQSPSSRPAATSGGTAPVGKQAKSTMEKEKEKGGTDGKQKKLDSVPQPNTQMLKQAQRAQQVDLTQSTGSGSGVGTQDTIRQFSSPLRPGDAPGPSRAEKGNGKGQSTKGAEREKENGRKDGTQKASGVGDDGAEAAIVEDSLPPGVERRIIDGEEVVVAIDSSDSSDGDADGDAAAEVEINADITDAVVIEEVVTEVIRVDVAQPITADVAAQAAPLPAGSEPVPEVARPAMVDQAVQVEVVSNAAGTMTDVAVVEKTVVMEVVGDAPAISTGKESGVPAVAPEVDQTLAATSEPPSTAELEVARLLIADVQAQLAAAIAETAEVRARNASLERDYTFIKAQYDNASTRAVEEVQANQNLTKKLKVKEQQLTLGLKQKDLHVAAIRQRDQDEIQALQIQVKVLLDQARRTDDSIRHKAAMYPRTKKENENLMTANMGLEKRVENLTKRNEELMDQVELLRARQMGVLDGEGGEGDGDSGSDTDTDTDSSGEYEDEDGMGGGVQDMAALGYSTRPNNMTSSGHTFSSPPTSTSGPRRSGPTNGVNGGVGIVTGSVRVIEVKEEEVGTITDRPGTAVECQWRDEQTDDKCGILLDSTAVSRHRPSVLWLRGGEGIPAYTAVGTKAALGVAAP